jgi:4-carboxymuconolactone decarboxylase
VQLYAYAGFPRSLNALAELMKVLEARKQRGIQDAPGRAPSRAIPKGEALLAAGTANQTKLTGVPVRGPLFDFAPAIDEYSKPTCSATSSSATTSIGKAASWPP